MGEFETFPCAPRLTQPKLGEFETMSSNYFKCLWTLIQPSLKCGQGNVLGNKRD